MVEIDITKSVEVPIPTQTGIVQQTISVATLFNDIVLNDKRFGENLLSVKMSAKIAAALNTAITDGNNLKLEDNEYAIVRVCIETPSNGFNPAIARFVLPLLEYILEAGSENPPVN